VCHASLGFGGESLRVDPAQDGGTLFLVQLVPLGVGLAVHQWSPILATRLRNPANLHWRALGLVAVCSILAVQFRMLKAIRPASFAGTLALLIASHASVWSAGVSDRGSRKAVTLGTSLRNVGVGLVIATGSFAGTPAVSAALPYGIIEIVGTVLLALMRGRSTATSGALGM
jgi:BASS family bile acid:Na+ symporter